MLSKISWRVILILLSAGTIAYLTFQYLDSLQETRTVVVASKDIQETTILDESMLEAVEVEAQAADMLVQERVEDVESVVGAITKTEIKEGEPVRMDPELLVFPDQTIDYVTDDGKVNTAMFIPGNMRLFTLALEPEEAVDNRLKKGDHVDVIYTALSQEAEQYFSRMILQHVEVYEVEEITVDNEFMGKEGILQHVTLLVSPQEAIALSNARAEGQLSLALNPSEGEDVETEIIYESTLEN